MAPARIGQLALSLVVLACVACESDVESTLLVVNDTGEPVTISLVGSLGGPVELAPGDVADYASISPPFEVSFEGQSGGERFSFSVRFEPGGRYSQDEQDREIRLPLSEFLQ